MGATGRNITEVMCTTALSHILHMGLFAMGEGIAITSDCDVFNT